MQSSDFHLLLKNKFIHEVGNREGGDGNSKSNLGVMQRSNKVLNYCNFFQFLTPLQFLKLDFISKDSKPNSMRQRRVVVIAFKDTVKPSLLTKLVSEFIGSNGIYPQDFEEKSSEISKQPYYSIKITDSNSHC